MPPVTCGLREKHHRQVVALDGFGGTGPADWTGTGTRNFRLMDRAQPAGAVGKSGAGQPNHPIGNAVLRQVLSTYTDLRNMLNRIKLAIPADIARWADEQVCVTILSRGKATA